jgi:hypothetical protein
LTDRGRHADHERRQEQRETEARKTLTALATAGAAIASALSERELWPARCAL